LGDFLVENRTCSTWTIKSDDFGGRQIRPIFALHDRRQIFVGRFYWQTKLANFIVRLTPALERKTAIPVYSCQGTLSPILFFFHTFCFRVTSLWGLWD